MTDTFDVFLIYNRRDAPAAREVAAALEARGLRVWPEEPTPEGSYQEALEEIIPTADAAVVLVGRDHLDRARHLELSACGQQFLERGMPLIPVLLPDTPRNIELPALVRQMTRVDLSGGITEAELDRLVWGITGRKPETLQAPRGRGPWLAAVIVLVLLLALIVALLGR